MYKVTTKLTQILRATFLFFHIFSGLIQSIAYPHLSQETQKWMAQKWSAKLLAILCIKLSFSGVKPNAHKKQVMFVANHVSWLDVYSLIALCPARFVAKSEIRNWPLLGWLSRNVGTLFIERKKRRDAARINQDIVTALENGDWVAVFPEGTTSDGNSIQYFHASLLQSAVTSGASLYPVAIRYHNTSGEISEAAAYIGISLLRSLHKILRQPSISVELIFTKSISSSGQTRRELARSSERAIADALSLSIPHRVHEKSSDLPIE